VVVQFEMDRQWELQGSMRCDELGDMRCLVPMK